MSLSSSPLRETSLGERLVQARAGSAEALGQLLEGCRLYLLVVARQELRAPLQAKVDAADLVQETFAEATRDFASFRGTTGQQLLSWLRGILRHNLADLTRRFASGCRSLSQEVPFVERLADRSRAAGRTVCEQLIAQEQRRALDAAFQRLPQAYQEVLHFRYGRRWSFAEIGDRLRRTPEAARKLSCRALDRLRQELATHADA